MRSLFQSRERVRSKSPDALSRPERSVLGRHHRHADDVSGGSAPGREAAGGDRRERITAARHVAVLLRDAAFFDPRPGARPSDRPAGSATWLVLPHPNRSSPSRRGWARPRSSRGSRSAGAPLRRPLVVSRKGPHFPGRGGHSHLRPRSLERAIGARARRSRRTTEVVHALSLRPLK
jgi:hypothetical protein